jgi:hypothetical protein
MTGITTDPQKQATELQQKGIEANLFSSPLYGVGTCSGPRTILAITPDKKKIIVQGGGGGNLFLEDLSFVWTDQREKILRARPESKTTFIPLNG